MSTDRLPYWGTNSCIIITGTLTLNICFTLFAVLYYIFLPCIYSQNLQNIHWNMSCHHIHIQVAILRHIFLHHHLVIGSFFLQSSLIVLSAFVTSLQQIAWKLKKNKKYCAVGICYSLTDVWLVMVVVNWSSSLVTGHTFCHVYL